MDYDDAKARCQWLDPIVVISGGFDPVHKGHTSMFRAAAEHGKVHVLLNSDDWLARKKGAPFLPFSTRVDILQNMSFIHRIHQVDDRDDTVQAGLRDLRAHYPYNTMYFANGGDRKVTNTPEMLTCAELNINLLWAVGGEKVESSSALLSKYEHRHSIKNLVSREWGTYEILRSGENWLTKILTVDPEKSISLQKHEYRSEEWLVLEGYGYYADSAQDYYATRMYPGLKLYIPSDTWHWVRNSEKEMPLLILETWLGETLKESDIERKEDESEIIILE